LFYFRPLPKRLTLRCQNSYLTHPSNELYTESVHDKTCALDHRPDRNGTGNTRNGDCVFHFKYTNSA